MDGTIAGRLARVTAEIATEARLWDRDPAGIDLVAVSKMHGAEAAAEAIQAGQRRFGENRVQEAQGKWPELKAAHPEVRLDLIGPLQTNKVRDAVALFDGIQSLDRESLAEKLAAEMARQGRRPACLVQVNTGEELQKAGIAPREADAFIRRCIEVHGLPVEGLMCVPPADQAPAPHFALLADMARRHGLARLSMGMSGDYAAAIRFGATEVRIGSAIFGARPPLVSSSSA